MLSQKVSKAVTPAKLVLDLIGERESPAAAGLIFLDSRFHGNDNNGCFLIFYRLINIDKPVKNRYLLNYSIYRFAEGAKEIFGPGASHETIIRVISRLTHSPTPDFTSDDEC